MGLLVEPIAQPQIQAWQIDPAAAADVMMALSTAASLGYTGTTTTFVQPNSTDIVWSLKLSKPGAADQTAYAGDWLVCDGHQVQVYKWYEFVGKYTTAEAPLSWDDSLAPAVEALPSDQVALTFALPFSPNGPFTFTVAATDTTADSTAPLEQVGDPVTVDGRVTVTGGGLVTGHDYTFTVTVHTNYDAAATSAPSDPVTATL